MARPERISVTAEEAHGEFLGAMAGVCTYDADKDTLICGYDPSQNSLQRTYHSLMRRGLPLDDILKVQNAAYDGLLAMCQEAHRLKPEDFND